MPLKNAKTFLKHYKRLLLGLIIIYRAVVIRTELSADINLIIIFIFFSLVN